MVLIVLAEARLLVVEDGGDVIGEFDIRGAVGRGFDFGFDGWGNVIERHIKLIVDYEGWELRRVLAPVGREDIGDGLDLGECGAGLVDHNLGLVHVPVVLGERRAWR